MSLSSTKGLAPFARTWHENLYVMFARRSIEALGTACRTCPTCMECLRRGWLVLHASPDADLALCKLGEDAVRHGAGCFLVADYALAERNLHLPATLMRFVCEALASGQGGHMRERKQFMQGGGIEGALQRAGAPLAGRYLAGCGLLTIAMCRCS